MVQYQIELVRQPADRYNDSAAKLQASNGELVQFGIDPTGGSILGLLVQAPNLKERVEQGGVVGYIILIVGAFGLLLALERLVTLTLTRMKVNKQLKSKEVNTNNPLGRVLKVRDEHPNADVEALELHLTEAILGEVPKLGRNLTIIKIISVVAPLMGLLGTVTGMINTFQAITLFGTGDPKLMAGGMEAYQVEMDYGRTMEAYSGIHSINGQERDVEFLRLGRTALIYQTRDASMQGVWNKQTRQWEELDSSYRTQITKGLRMAKKQLAPDLLMLPVAITD